MMTDALAAARQQALTSRLLGVDFLPLPSTSPASSAGGLSTSTSTEAANEPAEESASLSRSVKTDAAGASDQKSLLLRALRERHDAQCPHCTTATYHTQTVFGEGDPAARIMFVGEAPGEDEDRTGRPFVGKAGQKLNDIIKAMGLSREDVYIANILKSRPPENRTPLPDEVEKCSPYLHEQIRIIHPEVIVALGNPATKMLLQTDIGITRLRGQWGTYSHEGVRIAVMPTFHPAYLLRNYTPDTRKKMWQDMQAVMQRLQGA